MAAKRDPRSSAGKGRTKAAAATGPAGEMGFRAPSAGPSRPAAPGPREPLPKGSQVIPDAVAGRMMRRIAIATGLPSLLGMGVIIASYLLVSRHLLAIPPSATLLGSGAFFLLGLLGLSYGVLSASWEPAAGSLLGMEQIPVNFSRLRASLRALRQGGSGASGS